MNPSQLYKTAFDALVSLGANPVHSFYMAKECLSIAYSDPNLICVSNKEPPEVREGGDSRLEDDDGLVCFVSRKHKTAELFQRLAFNNDAGMGDSENKWQWPDKVLFQRSLNVRPTD